jgi:hypothetical protein
MKHVVYCILRDVRDPVRGVLPPGVESAPVFLVAEGGLAAACSVAPDACVTPTVSRATAFAWVVGALHAVTAVLPFRYGNFLDSGGRVLNLLRVHREEFLQSLEEVQGCDEMGLRILPEDRPGPACACPACAGPAQAGREYLEGRRAHYAAEECDEAPALRTGGAAAEARGALEGLAVKCREDRSSAADGRLLSLFFLVRRENVERFRQAFRQLQRETSAKRLLTGPWPPYNFVGSPCPDGRAERD